MDQRRSKVSDQMSTIDATIKESSDIIKEMGTALE